ncbi:MAG TPA: SDR family NAD(P)-dependent oxidoreductase [Hyphomicrobium sp.]|nr:SDR family NAD(P)-dependent oxidoreductase [Hyphomicrobium sp.]
MGASRPWKIVWITGASSGIGRELALRLACEGITVAATARSAGKLQALAASSPFIKPYPADVMDADAMRAAFASIERDLGAVDLAILNAGIWQGMLVSDFSAERGKHTMAVNYFGVLHALEPAMDAFAARGRGHLAIVSSVAGFRGMMKGAAYAPTKAALISLSESLYPHLARKGVKLTVINPGYIATPMTETEAFPKPFIIPVEQAAETILGGLARGKYEIVFPWRMALLMKTLRILPNWAFFRLVNIGINRGGTGEPPVPPQP